MKYIGTILLFCLIFTVWVQGETDPTQLIQEQWENSGLQQTIDQLDSQTKQLLEDFGISPKNVFSGKGFSFSSLGEAMSFWFTEAMSGILLAVGGGSCIILLSSFVKNISLTTETQHDLMEHFFATVCLTSVLIVPLGETLTKTATAIGGVGQFMLAFIPIYVGILMQAGHIFMAGSTGGVVFGCSQIIVYLANHLLMPLLGMFMGVSLCRWVSPGNKLTSMTAAIKKVVVWVLGISTTLYSAVLAITGGVQGAADSLSQRTTRYFIGNMVPVVGGALSESVGMVQSCLSLVKTGSGMIGIGVVLVMLLPVFLEIVLWRLGVMVLTSLSEIMDTSLLTGLLQSIGDTIGIVFSVIVCCFVVYVVSLGVMASAGG